MTEAEWLTCGEPGRMVEFLVDKVSDRKGNLFLCGVCRHNWGLLYDESSRECVRIAENYLEGQATKEEMHWARWAAEVPTFGFDFNPAHWKQWVEPGEIPASVQRLLEMGVLSKEDLDSDGEVGDPDVRWTLGAAACLAERLAASKPFEHYRLGPDLARVEGPHCHLLRRASRFHVTRPLPRATSCRARPGVWLHFVVRFLFATPFRKVKAVAAHGSRGSPHHQKN